jgi:restriction system protein
MTYSNWERQQRAAVREAEQAQRRAERERVAAEKESLRLYHAGRTAEAERRTADVAAIVASLRGVLAQGISRPASLDLAALRRYSLPRPADLGALGRQTPMPEWTAFAPAPPTFGQRLLGGQARYERKLSDAKTLFERQVEQATLVEQDRQDRVRKLLDDHAKQLQVEQQAAEAHNREIDDFAARFDERDKAAVEWHLAAVLARTPLPAGCPRQPRIAYSPRGEQILIQWDLPEPAIVPDVVSYRYIAKTDETRTTPAKPKDIVDLYVGVVAQIALLVIRDTFGSDQHLTGVGFNGHVHTVNPATGKPGHPCTISLLVDRDVFPSDAELRNVRPEACVRHLGAIVSRHPDELDGIEPILDFDLTKYSFVEGRDAVATLDSRPDLMQMSPENFEHLVRQLFEAQGIAGWTTEQSNDDGVDAVIANYDSLVGGLAIVQAKRYSRAVGVNHIRELAGAMQEKKAGKGILVTTAWFTPKSREKARENARMELIDGENLVYLIKRHLGKDVLISLPNRPKTSPRSTSSAT